MKLSSFIQRLKNVLKLHRNDQEKSILQPDEDVSSAEAIEHDNTVEIPHSKLNRFALFIYGTFLVIFLGGAGLIVGWVLVSAENTIEKRIAITPAVTVDVLADGETAPIIPAGERNNLAIKQPRMPLKPPLQVYQTSLKVN